MFWRFLGYPCLVIQGEVTSSVQLVVIQGGVTSSVHTPDTGLLIWQPITSSFFLTFYCFY